jgi:hypothetical protein
VAKAARAALPDASATFKCGLSETHNFEVHRTLPGPAHGGEPAHEPESDTQAPDDPLENYIERIDVSCALGKTAWAALRADADADTEHADADADAPVLQAPTVPKPWVSFGSATSVVLNWLAAGQRFD